MNWPGLVIDHLDWCSSCWSSWTISEVCSCCCRRRRRLTVTGGVSISCSSRGRTSTGNSLVLLPPAILVLDLCSSKKLIWSSPVCEPHSHDVRVETKLLREGDNHCCLWLWTLLVRPDTFWDSESQAINWAEIWEARTKPMNCNFDGSATKTKNPSEDKQ